MNDQLAQDYFQNGYTLHPSLLDSRRVKNLLGEIERICGDNTLAAHDKSRLEMEPDQPPSGKLVRRIYQPCTHYEAFRELSESAELLDLVEKFIGPNILF